MSIDDRGYGKQLPDKGCLNCKYSRATHDDSGRKLFCRYTTYEELVNETGICNEWKEEK